MNAQILLLVRSSAPLTASQIQGPIEAAARAAGFVPGPWAFDTQFAPVGPDPSFPGGLAAVVLSGPWAGFSFTTGGTAADPRITGPTNIAFNAYRQNLLNGPSSGAAVLDGARAAILGLPGVRGWSAARRSPSTAVSWDRGIPAPIALTSESTSSGGNIFLGVLAIAGLAWWASRGAAKGKPLRKPMFAGARLGESWNREHMTFTEWARAAGMDPKRPRAGARAAWARAEDPTEWRAAARTVAGAGLAGTDKQHFWAAKNLFEQAARDARKGNVDAARREMIRAVENMEWLPSRKTLFRPHAQQELFPSQRAALEEINRAAQRAAQRGGAYR